MRAKKTREITGNSRASRKLCEIDCISELLSIESAELSLISCQKAGRVEQRDFISKQSREAHTATFPMLFAKYQYQLAIARRDRVIIKSS